MGVSSGLNYSWCCARFYGVLVTELKSVISKTSILSTILSLVSYKLFFVMLCVTVVILVSFLSMLRF